MDQGQWEPWLANTKVPHEGAEVQLQKLLSRYAYKFLQWCERSGLPNNPGRFAYCAVGGEVAAGTNQLNYNSCENINKWHFNIYICNMSPERNNSSKTYYINYIICRINIKLSDNTSNCNIKREYSLYLDEAFMGKNFPWKCEILPWN